MSFNAWVVGAISALGPLILMMALWLQGPGWLTAGRPWEVGLAALATLGMTSGGLLIGEMPRHGRRLVSFAVAAWLAANFLPLSQDPMRALAVLLVLVGALGAVWSLEWGDRARPGPSRVPLYLAHRARASAVGSILAWAGISLAGVRPLSAVIPLLGASLAIMSAFTLHWASVRRGGPAWQRDGLWVLFWAPLLAAIPALWGLFAPASLLVLAAPVACLVLVRERSSGPDVLAGWWEPVLSHPSSLLVLTFGGLCLAGTILLSLPMSAARGEIHLIDAAFTAVSAVCVTGLTVLDTPRDFTGAGQGAILLLIQLGGLGIMTFSTAAFAILGRRLSLSHERTMAGLLGEADRGAMFRRLWQVLIVTFGAELLGALVLLVAFLGRGEGVGASVWGAVFTAISAFCNAGFALKSDNLMSYADAPVVLHTVAALIILGGLSPAVIVAMPRMARGRMVPVQMRLVLGVTAILLVGGALAFLGAEWNGVLARLSVVDRLHNAWFQSVTTRTAGFNSLDMVTLSDGTITLMLVLMFIGGSPGGTAGGIKTSTAALLVLAVTTAIQGREKVSALGRSFNHETVYKAAAIATVGVLSTFAGLMALQLTQELSYELALFEVVSALGTVGLTIGATPLLDGAGKIIIMVCMFMGRVGPLTLFFFLAGRPRDEAWKHPEAQIDVG